MTNPYGDWIEDPLAPSGYRWVRHGDQASTLPPSEPVRLPIQPVDAPPRPGDIGDWIDPNAPDPTPDEVTDPRDPNYVQPWAGGR